MGQALASRELLEALGALAVEAGREAMCFYDGECAVATKQDGSKVTQADLAAEAVILPGLSLLHL